jgi:hypothetical protein
VSLREFLTDAIRYWEPRRVLYNVILVSIVLTYFGRNYPVSREGLLSLNGALIIFILAVLANVAYCSAYAVDILVQLSGFRLVWLRYRWILFILGTSFASAITRFFALGILGPPQATIG